MCALSGLFGWQSRSRDRCPELAHTRSSNIFRPAVARPSPADPEPSCLIGGDLEPRAWPPRSQMPVLAGIASLMVVTRRSYC